MSTPSNPNPNIVFLDGLSMDQRAFDGDNDAYRIELASGTSFAVSLDYTNDSVETHPYGFSSKASITSSNSGTIINPITIDGIKSFNLYTNTTTNVSVAQICTMQVSPSSTDDVWIDTSLNITPSTSSGIVVMGTVNSAIVAKRARVKIAASITSGTFDIYLVGQSV